MLGGYTIVLAFAEGKMVVIAFVTFRCVGRTATAVSDVVSYKHWFRRKKKQHFLSFFYTFEAKNGFEIFN
jgi:hypothetical protein